MNNKPTTYNYPMSGHSKYKKKIKSSPYNHTCINCEKNNHEYKQCTQPITSWGVVLVDLCGCDISLDDDEYDISTDMPLNIEIDSIEDRMKVSNSFTNIRFLMISRKYSLGYIEFVRGRYKPHMIDQTIYLFKQMKQEEIDRINRSQDPDKGFDFLWEDVWKERSKSHFFAKEYEDSKYNYETLRYKGLNGPDIGLDFIVKNVRPDYIVEEWGFPKGRRNKMETVRECAIREFKEETGYMEDDFKVIDKIKPLVEEFTGTNGIKYRHIYYIAHLTSGKTPLNNQTRHQIHEVGNIGFFDFQTAIEYIREYHTDRKKIIKNLFMFYLNRIINKSIVLKNKSIHAMEHKKSNQINRN